MDSINITFITVILQTFIILTLWFLHMNHVVLIILFPRYCCHYSLYFCTVERNGCFLQFIRDIIRFMVVTCRNLFFFVVFDHVLVQLMQLYR